MDAVQPVADCTGEEDEAGRSAQPVAADLTGTVQRGEDGVADREVRNRDDAVRRSRDLPPLHERPHFPVSSTECRHKMPVSPGLF